KSSTGHHELALLIGLLKNLESPSDSLRERDAVMLLNAISQLDEQQKFGEHWWYLKGRGYAEIGFQEEAERMYEQFRIRFPAIPLEQRFRGLVDSRNPELNSFVPPEQSPSRRLPQPDLNGPVSLESFLTLPTRDQSDETSGILFCQQLL